MDKKARYAFTGIAASKKGSKNGRPRYIVPPPKAGIKDSNGMGEIPGALLRKGILPELWEPKTELTFSEFKAYFAGVCVQLS